jgi:hypothetical protein
MNKKQDMMFKNRMCQHIRSANRCGSHNGCLKIWKGNTYEHEKAKFDICFKLINEGWDIWTECIFMNGDRADIVAIGFGRAVIIEIETPKSQKAMKEKLLSKENYPDDFEKILFITDEDVNKLSI